jgi:hypothetical protein
LRVASYELKEKEITEKWNDEKRCYELRVAGYRLKEKEITEGWKNGRRTAGIME